MPRIHRLHRRRVCPSVPHGFASSMSRLKIVRYARDLCGSWLVRNVSSPISLSIVLADRKYNKLQWNAIHVRRVPHGSRSNKSQFISYIIYKISAFHNNFVYVQYSKPKLIYVVKIGTNITRGRRVSSIMFGYYTVLKLNNRYRVYWYSTNVLSSK